MLAAPPLSDRPPALVVPPTKARPPPTDVLPALMDPPPPVVPPVPSGPEDEAMVVIVTSAGVRVPELTVSLIVPGSMVDWMTMSALPR
jgi:hypothetical protein